jgi:hypothetical protein
MEDRDDLIVGMWKFLNDKVSKDELKILLEEFLKDEKYLVLYLRKASTDQTGLGLVRKNTEGSEGFDKYFDEVSDLLKKKFGNGLAGWDFAPRVLIAKWSELQSK